MGGERPSPDYLMPIASFSAGSKGRHTRHYIPIASHLVSVAIVSLRNGKKIVFGARRTRPRTQWFKWLLGIQKTNRKQGKTNNVQIPPSSNLQCLRIRNLFPSSNIKPKQT